MQMLHGSAWRGEPLLVGGESAVQTKSYDDPISFVKQLQQEFDADEEAQDEEAPASAKALGALYDGIDYLHTEGSNHLDGVYDDTENYLGHVKPAAARDKIHGMIRRHKQKMDEWHAFNEKMLSEIADHFAEKHPDLEPLDVKYDDEDMD